MELLYVNTYVPRGYLGKMGLEDTWRDLLAHAQRERAQRTDDHFRRARSSRVINGHWTYSGQ